MTISNHGKWKIASRDIGRTKSVKTGKVGTKAALEFPEKGVTPSKSHPNSNLTLFLSYCPHYFSFFLSFWGSILSDQLPCESQWKPAVPGGKLVDRSTLNGKNITFPCELEMCQESILLEFCVSTIFKGPENFFLKKKKTMCDLEKGRQ